MNNQSNEYSRRNFIRKAALGVVGGIAVPSSPPVNAKNPNQNFDFAAQPVLANVGANKIEIIVAPNDLATGWVAYGESRQLDHQVDGTVDGRFPFSDRVLHFQLEDLEPGKKYYYQVHLQRVVFESKRSMNRTEEIASEVFEFSTLDPQSGTANFCCWNDTHENEETITRLNGILDKQQPDFLLWNGDVTNDIFQEEQIVGQFLNPANQAYATSTPVIFSRGNHDVRGRAAPYLRDYMTGPGGDYHFGFRQGPIAFLVMDTGEDKPDDHIEYGGLANFAGYRSMQAEWLERIIEEPWFKEAPFRVVFMHIPIIWDKPNQYREWDGKCAGWMCEDAYDKWNALLTKANVQIVMSGHTHRHAYLPPDEDRSYGQLVGGGPQPERATCITGYADESVLRVSMTDLDQNVLETIEFTS